MSYSSYHANKAQTGHGDTKSKTKTTIVVSACRKKKESRSIDTPSVDHQNKGQPTAGRQDFSLKTVDVVFPPQTVSQAP